MRKFYAGILLGIGLMVAPFGGRGQVSITSTGTAYIQNFDAMGSSGSASLPTGFKIGNDWTTGTAVTTLAYGTTGTGDVTGTSGGGVINWANGITASSTDRSLGFLNTGSYGTPQSIILKISNNTGSTINSLDISFVYEKYRTGTRQFDWTFFHGSTATPATPASAGDQSYSADANNTVINDPPIAIAKSLSITGLTIYDGTDYYFRWTLTGLGGSSNGQGLGIDNFSITCNTAGYSISVTQATGGNISPGTTNVSPSGSQSFTATANACYNFSHWVVDNSIAGNANPFIFSSVAAPHTITAVFTSNAPAAPTALSATNGNSNSFIANWTAEAGATGYYVDVYETSISNMIINESFDAGTAVPSGWTFSGIGGTYITATNFGNSSPSLQMDATNDRVLTSTFPNAATQLSFWLKGQSTDNTSALLVEGYNGSSWVIVQNITNSIPVTGTTFTYNSSTSPALPANIVQFRFTYTKSLGNLAFDDLSIIYPSSAITFVTGFQNIFVSSNSLDVTGLAAGVTYSYVVRSFNGECTSANSNVITNPSAAACSGTTPITSFFPSSGPVGTMVTITGTGFSITPVSGGVKFGEILSTSYKIVSNTSIIAEVPPGASATSLIKVANASACWNSSAGIFSLIASVGTCTMTDLIISEVFDPVSGNEHYIEVFNGTSSSINLNSPNNYTMQVWNDPNTTTTFDISGTIAPGQVRVYYAGTSGGLATAPAQGAGVGFNQDDEVRLLKNGTVIDRMIAPGNTGYNWRRRSSVTGPNVTYTASEWILKEETDVNLFTTDIGTFTTGTDLDFTTHPVDQTCSFSMSAVATGSISGYQWMFFDPTDSTWKNVNLANLPGTVQPGGAQTSSLTITGNIAPYINYQFYLEIRNGSSCSRASNAAQFSYDTKAYYKANVVSGDWTTPGSWLMSDVIDSGYGPTCTYPTAANSQAVIIPAGTKIIHAVNQSISIDKITIQFGSELELGTLAGIKILNGQTGSDFIVEGTLLDRSSSGAGNGFSFEDNSGTANDANWNLASTGKVIKTNNSGVADFRDFYFNGIINIPAASNWVYRYEGAGTTPVTVTSGMYYPNLYFESISGAYSWNAATTALIGSANTMNVYGNLYIGTTGTGTVSVYYNNLNISPMQVGGNIEINSGSTLTNQSYDNTVVVGTRGHGTGFDLKGNLVVNGILTNNGATTNQGMLRFSGNSNQTISGSGTMNLEDVNINNSIGANVIVDKDFDIPGTLSFGASGKLNLNTRNISLKSSIARTANVGIIPSMNAIIYNSGRFIVERYINTGIGHARSWQLLSTPTVGQTIKNSWQESGSNSISGYGTQITGPVVANGIDSYTIHPALKTFNSSTGLWDGISNTETTPVNNAKGYMLFVRGDRTSVVTPTYQPPAVPTVLRTAGIIYQPSQPPPGFTGVNSLGPDQWQSVGNPYASPISLVTMFGSTTYWNNIYKAVSVWDPGIYGANAVGGYQTISATNLYKPVPGGSSIYNNTIPFENIQSGQAFFVQALPSGGTISFAEAIKSDVHTLVNFAPANPAGTSAFFRTTLYDAAGNITDGNVVAFNRRYSNYILGEDAPKVYNSGDNFGILSHNRWLAVEGREPLQEQDTIQFSMYNLRAQQTYRLGFAPENIREPNLQAWLVDRYLGTRTLVALTDSSFASFSINAETKSKSPERFYVAFLPKKVPAPKTVQFLAPVQDVPWPGTIIEGENGGIISVYPNPVSGRQLNVQLNEFIPGIYNIQLFNAQGLKVYQYTITIESKSVNKTIKLPPGIAAGNYRLQLKNDNSTKNVNVIIQ